MILLNNSLFFYYKDNKTFFTLNISDFHSYLLLKLTKFYWLTTLTKKRYYFGLFFKYLSNDLFYNLFLHINQNQLILMEKFNIFNNLSEFFLLYSFEKSVYYLNITKYKKINTNLLLFSQVFMQFYLNYAYYHAIWIKFRGLKKNLWRNSIEHKYDLGFLGYKMVFYGRFSRKQRARSVSYKGGKVPLNTLNAQIDYAFFMVPLRNSAVSIKVWFYKKKQLAHYKYSLSYETESK